MRCLIYSRVSTDAQVRDGISLETQERACEEYAAPLGWMVVSRIHVIGRSDLSGLAKAGWMLGIIVLPLIGSLIYMST